MKHEQTAEARARQLSGLEPHPAKPVRRKAKRSNAEHARQYGAEMIDRLVEIARHGEPDAARIVAANSVLERGFGKVLGSDPTATTGPTVVRVITGVHDPTPGEGLPPPRPLLSDGRDPLAKPPPGSRPVGRAPVQEPLQHRLFEADDADKPKP